MSNRQPAKLLRIYFAGGRPVYEAIVAKCREMHIAGATVLRGDEGFGSGPEIESKPVVIAIVDEPAKIDALLPAVEALLPGGAMVVSKAEMIRVKRD